MFFSAAIQALEKSGVRYCVVGGLAVSLHGIPRTTYDLDIVVVPDRASLTRLDRVLADLGLLSRHGFDLVELAEETTRSRYLEERNLVAVSYVDPDDPLRAVDVLVAPPADPDALVARAKRMPVGGMTVCVASIEDLIAMKRAAGRPQDLADIVHLERLMPRQP